MVGNGKTPEVVRYMVRHLLTFNISDALTDASRGIDNDFYQYFNGTGAAGQVNYLECKPYGTGPFNVYVSGVLKTDGVDYTLDRTAGTITWTGHTPASAKDNIKASYQAVKRWIYDDTPNLDANYFPRISVMPAPQEYEPFGFGTYVNYNSGPGDHVTANFKIIVRSKKKTASDREMEFYTIAGQKYANNEVADAISEQIVNYFKTHRYTPPWKFFDLIVGRSEPNMAEMEHGIFRRDITLEVQYFDKSA